MRKAFTAETEATPDELFATVSDLQTYPAWLDVVHKVEIAERPDAWVVTLRARVGPFARSKRLRMVRAESGASPAVSVGTAEARSILFHREELDGKTHSEWTMAAEVRPLDAPPNRSVVTVDLDYGGSMWVGPLDAVLDAAASRAAQRLQEHVRR